MTDYNLPGGASASPWINAQRYTTVQDAIDACHSHYLDSDKTQRVGIVEVMGEHDEPLILRSGVHLKGGGRGSTILKMPAGGTGDVIKSESYDTLVGTDGGNLWVGEHHTRISDLTVDGNKANAPSGRNGISLYGYNQAIDRVHVLHCIQDGIHTDAPVPAGIENVDDQDGLINRFDMVDVNNCDRDGIRWSGPNDSQLSNVVPWKNSSAQLRVTEKGTGLVISKLHPYAGNSPTTAVGDYGLWSDVPVICHQCQFESQSLAVVYLTGEASTYAFQGADGTYLNGCWIFLAISGSAGLMLDGSVTPLANVWCTEARFISNKTAIKPIGSGHSSCKITGWSYSSSGDTMLDTSTGDLTIANNNHLELLSIGPGTATPRYQIPSGYGPATFAAGIAQLHVSGTHAARVAVTSPPVGQLWKETDTGLIYRGTGTAWDIWKAQGVVPKTADETVNNSATLQDDDHLKFPIGVSEKWWFRLYMSIVSPSVNSDMKLGLTAPTGAAVSWSTPGNFVPVAAASTPNLMSANLSPPFQAGSGNGTWINAMWGWITADATHAGTVQLQWAQQTATAEDTTVKAGSFLELIRLI